MHETERAEIIDTICKQERRYQGYGLLKYFRGKSVRSQAVNKIIVPSSWASYRKTDQNSLEDPKKLYLITTDCTDISNDPNLMTINTPAEILYYCKVRNQQHFGQTFTNGTPFIKEYLSTRFL